jgi:uncharacterized protein
VPLTDDDRLREVLDETECRRLLATTTTGRLGFTDSALPAIVPVPFAVHDGHVLVAARRGSPMVKAVRGSVVAFQTDTYDPGAGTGWSVTAVGPSRVISDPGLVAELDGLDRSDLPQDPSRCYISVQLAMVRGWRMTPLLARSPGTSEDAVGHGTGM